MRYRQEFLTNIHSRTNGNTFSNTVRCAREDCAGDIASGEAAWTVSHNGSNGWVTRIAHVHPACGEGMVYRTSRGMVPATNIRPVDER